MGAAEGPLGGSNLPSYLGQTGRPPFGLHSASIQAIFPGPLHYQAMQRLKTHYLCLHYSYDHGQDQDAFGEPHRASMVAPPHRSLEWQADLRCHPGFHTPVGCQPLGLGCLLRERSHGWMMDVLRGTLALQLSGTHCRILCNLQFCQDMLTAVS